MKDKQTRLSQLSDLLHENKERQQHLVENINTYQNKIKQLYHMANVNDEESFYKKANDLERFEQLQISINKINEQYLNIFNSMEKNHHIQTIAYDSVLYK